MQKLAEICIRRPVFATMLVTSLFVIGAFAYFRLGVDLFPKVDLPTVTITTRLDGASPEEVESQISKKVEEAVNTISGIDELRSVSAEGVSQVFVTFALERDVDEAAQDVRDRVGRIVGDLPTDVDPPVIEKLDPDAQPVLSLAISANRSPREITDTADKMIKQNLESLSGVGQVIFIGDRKREIQVVLDAQKVASYNLSIDSIKQALAAQNVEIPGGRIDQGKQEIILRTLGRITQVTDFNNVILGARDGLPIYVKDVGYVEDGVEEPRSLARLDGQQAVVLLIRKQSGTNTVAVVEHIKERLQSIKSILPPDYRIQIAQDQSVFIESAFHSVQEHLVLGGILAAIVVLVFLGNWRSTIISAIAIPVSIISTFALMYAMGFTLNRMTMLALTLSVGIVIDDAVVVLENIFRFVEEKNMSPMEAAKEATADIGLAVLATTLSLVIIFLPVAFMGGIVGRFMSSFGFTSAFAILVSMLVSFTLTPMLCSRFLKAEHKKEGEAAKSRSGGFYGMIDRSYTAMLKYSLRHPILVIVVSVVVVASVVPVFQIIGKDFLPQDDQSRFEVLVKLPEGNSLSAAQERIAQIEEEVKKIPHVIHVLSTIGGDEQRRVTRATLSVELKPISERKESQPKLMDLARKSLAKFSDIGIQIQNPAAISGGGQTNADVQYVIRGPEIETLTTASANLMGFMRNVKGVVDVDSNLEVGKPEMRAIINRPKASDLGVNVASIASALRTMVAGEVVSSYREGDDRYDIRLRVEPTDRDSSIALLRTYVPSSKLGNVPLSNVVTMLDGTGPAQINRYNRQRQVTVTANLQQGQSQSVVLTEIEKKIKELNLGPQYTAAPQGRSRELGRAAQNFALAFILSFVFMYMILAAQFESFLHPVTILLSLPMAIPFALLSLLPFGQTLNIFSALGILMLFGVVKKNSILQIDHINTLRAEGMPRFEAIVEGCRDRLRPILMTTLALVAGLIPMAVGQGAGSGALRSVAIIVIGGQSLCLLLTLLATPVLYATFDTLVRIFSLTNLGAQVEGMSDRVRGMFDKKLVHTDD